MVGADFAPAIEEERQAPLAQHRGVVVALPAGRGEHDGGGHLHHAEAGCPSQQGARALHGAADGTWGAHGGVRGR